MTSTQERPLGKASGHARRLLAAVVGLFVSLALIVSGAAPASAQNAVGPQPVKSILNVGPHDDAAQENVGVRGPPLHQSASATGVAADTATSGGEDVTRLYRAVDPGELKDIEGTGVYRPAPGGTEGKYFFPTEGQAENFSNMMEKTGTGPYCITSGCIPTSVLRGIDTIHPAGEGTAYFIPQDLLPYFSNIIVHGP